MSRSLVVCLALSTAAAATAAGLCLAAGGGAILAVAAYVGTGSLALTGLTLLSALWRSRPAREETATPPVPATAPRAAYAPTVA